MSNKSRGIQKEREAKHLLEEQGYVTLRCRGSLGIVDLVAINEFSIRFVSVKRVKGKYYSFKDEIEKLSQFKCPKDTSKELWIWVDKMKDRKAGWIIKKI